MESANGPIVIDRAWYVPASAVSDSEVTEIPIVSGECVRSPRTDFRHSPYWDRPWSDGCWYCGARGEQP
jgi:hypothetical protein